MFTMNHAETKNGSSDLIDVNLQQNLQSKHVLQRIRMVRSEGDSETALSNLPTISEDLKDELPVTKEHDEVFSIKRPATCINQRLQSHDALSLPPLCGNQGNLTNRSKSTVVTPCKHRPSTPRPSWSSKSFDCLRSLESYNRNTSGKQSKPGRRKSEEHRKGFMTETLRLDSNENTTSSSSTPLISPYNSTENISEFDKRLRPVCLANAEESLANNSRSQANHKLALLNRPKVDLNLISNGSGIGRMTAKPIRKTSY
eukprot:gene16116-17741_t